MLDHAGRFWSHVDKNGPVVRSELGSCWLWTGKLDGSGYGLFHVQGKRVRAHRFSLLLDGKDPGKLCGLHHCDVRNCVRPTHLFRGTRGDNLQDAINKGRHSAPTPPKGEKHSQAKLTDEEVLQIRARYAIGGILQRELAAEFGVHQSLISNIMTGRLWSHV